MVTIEASRTTINWARTTTARMPHLLGSLPSRLGPTPVVVSTSFNVSRSQTPHPCQTRGTRIHLATPRFCEPFPDQRPGTPVPGGGHTGAMALQPAARHLLRARDLADSRYSESLTVADLSEAAGLSQAHFSGQFKRTFGESPHQYLLTRRLERAAALLCSTDWSVTDICFAVGATSLGSFCTSFRRMLLHPGQGPAPPARLPAVSANPCCVAQVYARRQNRTFREDARDTSP